MTKRRRLFIIAAVALSAAWVVWKLHQGRESWRLIAELKSSDLVTARAAADALSRRSDMIAVNGVVRLLQSDRYRPRARHVVMRMGQPGIDRLVAVGVRRRSDTVSESMELRAYINGYSERHISARDVLIRIGSPCIPKVLPHLDSRYPDVRSRAAEVLGAMSDPVAVDAVIKALDDSEDAVPVTEGLYWLARRSSVNPRIVDRLLVLTYSQIPDVRQSAAWPLADGGDAKYMKQYVERLKAFSQETKAAPGLVESSIIHAIGQVKDPKTVPLLIDRLSSTSAQVRGAAIEALGKIGGREAALAIAPYCEDAEELIRVTAVNALGSAGWGGSGDVLARHLNDKDDVGRKAAFALGRLGDARAVPVLIGVAANSEDSGEYTASQAMLILGRFKSGEVVDALLAGLASGERTSAAAAIALGDTGDVRAVGPLAEAVSLRPAGETRGRSITAAGIALVEIGTSEALAAVDEAVQGRDLSEIAANCRKHIEAGNDADLTPLMLALAKHGNLEMARAFLYCEKRELREAAYAWALHAFGELEPLYNRGHEADYPTWEGW